MTSTPKATKTPTDIATKRKLRRKLKTEGRKKRVLKLKTDPAFSKTYFEARSKKATDKKVAFRRKKTKKK